MCLESPANFRDERRVLGGDAGSAAEAALAGRVLGIGSGEMALAEHGAADRHEEARAEADAIRAEQDELEELLAVLDAAVDAQLDLVA